MSIIEIERCFIIILRRNGGEKMLKLEEYISKRKKEDRIDEFDFKKHSENMGSVIKYVTDYFNNYLNLEDYDYEQTKIQQTVEKFKKDIQKRYPETYDYIISYYLDNKKRLDKYIAKAYKEIKDSELFYKEEDYDRVAEYVIEKKLNVPMNETLCHKLSVMAREYKKHENECPSISEMKELDNALVDWVKCVFRKYNVNLLNYASEIAYHYYETYVVTEYDRDTDTFYHINKYDYRYQENPFDINTIYARNEHREFIKDNKGELEMLIMYCWLNDEIRDLDYWPEYVQLCIDSNRVKLSKRKCVFMPVQISNINYPPEIVTSGKYIETVNGLIEKDPGKDYILRIAYPKNNDEIWKDKMLLESIIKNIQSSFKRYGTPSLVEFQSPYKTVGYNKEKFFDSYQVFEKGLRRFTNTKIAIINGNMKGSKGKEFLFSNIDDIIKLHNTCKQLNLRLKLSVDFTDSNRKNILKEKIEETINALSSMRSFIVGIHLNSIDSWSNYRGIYDEDSKHAYMSVHEYPTVSTFMQGLATIVQDSKVRYLIPEKVKNEDVLEGLIDILYRAGFSFKKGGNVNEK
ncbi:hypothetical protein DP134_13210 [Clostridium tetani]|nr:hypothetical protein DP132_01275 [Clostridium tetani]RXI67107.1 hypothetical protein DP121_13460 [Clostridium tetani]RXM54098.1 hypothetical protein DP134_13210 [Clostridium tetani]